MRVTVLLGCLLVFAILNTQALQINTQASVVKAANKNTATKTAKTTTAKATKAKATTAKAAKAKATKAKITKAKKSQTTKAKKTKVKTKKAKVKKTKAKTKAKGTKTKTKTKAKTTGHASGKAMDQIEKLQETVKKLIKKKLKGLPKNLVKKTKSTASTDSAKLAHYPGICICNDSCNRASDGVCDDGLPGSQFSKFCSPGTDCSDCGPSTRAVLTPLTKCSDLVGALVTIPMSPGPVIVTPHTLAKASLQKLKKKNATSNTTHTNMTTSLAENLGYGANYHYGYGYTWPTETHSNTDTDTAPTDSFSVTASASHSLSVVIAVDDSMTTADIEKAVFTATHPPPNKVKETKPVDSVKPKKVNKIHVYVPEDSTNAKLQKQSLSVLGHDMGSQKANTIISDK